MDEPVTPNAPPPSPPPAMATLGPSWAAMGLALIAIGAVAYVLIADRAEKQNLADAQAQMTAQIQLLEAKLAEQTKAGEARSAELSALTQSLAQSVSRTARERAVLDAENLLDLANQRLQFAFDVRGAIQAMGMADDRLRVATDPSLNAIRRTLAEEIVKLRAVPGVDAAGIQTKIEGVTAQIDHMPLRGKRAASLAAATPVAAAKLDTWQDWVAAVWTQLKQLITIRYNDKPVGPLLPPDQAMFLLQNLRIKLEAARLAVLMHDQTAYQQTVQAAELWLRSYFDTAAPTVNAALVSVQELSRYNVQPPLPDISNSLRLLRQRARELGLASNGAG